MPDISLCVLTTTSDPPCQLANRCHRCVTHWPNIETNWQAYWHPLPADLAEIAEGKCSMFWERNRE